MDNVRYNRIKAVLAEQDKTGTWLSEQMGRNLETVSRWMTNKIQPSVEQLFDIAKHLDVDVREYMDQSSLIIQFGNKIWYFHLNIVYLHSKKYQ